jgi:hypothetical protein
MLAGVWLCAGARAGTPDAQVFPAAGDRLLLWVASERGRSEPELAAAGQLAARGVEVWSLDAVGAYFLPQLPSSMEKVPVDELAAWLLAAEAGGKQVTVYAVARAAVPVLRAAAQLAPAARGRLCVLLMYPNLYTQAEPLAEPDYLGLGDLGGLRVRVLQPRRSAATPWLARQRAHLAAAGATVDSVILENLREAFWARETPTDFETAESRRLGERLLEEMDAWGCR